MRRAPTFGVIRNLLGPLYVTFRKVVPRRARDIAPPHRPASPGLRDSAAPGKDGGLRTSSAARVFRPPPVRGRQASCPRHPRPWLAIRGRRAREERSSGRGPGRHGRTPLRGDVGNVILTQGWDYDVFHVHRGRDRPGAGRTYPKETSSLPPGGEYDVFHVLLPHQCRRGLQPAGRHRGLHRRLVAHPAGDQHEGQPRGLPADRVNRRRPKKCRADRRGHRATEAGRPRGRPGRPTVCGSRSTPRPRSISVRN